MAVIFPFGVRATVPLASIDWCKDGLLFRSGERPAARIIRSCCLPTGWLVCHAQVSMRSCGVPTSAGACVVLLVSAPVASPLGALTCTRLWLVSHGGPVAIYRTVALLTIGRSLRRSWSTRGSLAGGSCSWCRLFWRFPTFLYRFRLLFTDLSFGFGEVGGYRSCSVVRRIGGSKQRPSEWFDFCLGLETHPFVKILGSRTTGMSGHWHHFEGYFVRISLRSHCFALIARQPYRFFDASRHQFQGFEFAFREQRAVDLFRAMRISALLDSFISSPVRRVLNPIIGSWVLSM